MWLIHGFLAVYPSTKLTIFTHHVRLIGFVKGLICKLGLYPRFYGIDFSAAQGEMCYKVSPFRTRVDWAKAKCVKFGGNLIRVRSDEDVLTVASLTR